jgi:hypothetical protein
MEQAKRMRRGRIFKEGEEKESRNNFLLFPLLKPPLEVMKNSPIYRQANM